MSFSFQNRADNQAYLNHTNHTTTLHTTTTQNPTAAMPSYIVRKFNGTVAAPAALTQHYRSPARTTRPRSKLRRKKPCRYLVPRLSYFLTRSRAKQHAREQGGKIGHEYSLIKGFQ